MDRIEKLLKEYMKYKRKMEAIEMTLKGLKHQIEEEMKKQGLKKIQTSQATAMMQQKTKVTAKPGKFKEVLDTIPEDYLELSVKKMKKLASVIEAHNDLFDIRTTEYLVIRGGKNERK